MLELLHVEQNLFTRLSRDVLGFRCLQDLRLGWLQFCNPPLQEAMKLAGETSSYQLTILQLFEDFKQENAYPRDISCVAVIQKYSFADPYLHIDAKGTPKSPGQNVLLFAIQREEFGVARSLVYDNIASCSVIDHSQRNGLCSEG